MLPRRRIKESVNEVSRLSNRASRNSYSVLCTLTRDRVSQRSDTGFQNWPQVKPEARMPEGTNKGVGNVIRNHATSEAHQAARVLDLGLFL